MKHATNDADLLLVRTSRELRARALGITQGLFKCSTCGELFNDWPVFANLRRGQVFCDEHGFPPDHVDDLWDAIPEHLQDGLQRYMMEHVRPGDFLVAILASDLHDAVLRAADAVAFFGIRPVVHYLRACANPKCYGSRDIVDRWIAFPVMVRLERSVGRSPFDLPI